MDAESGEVHFFASKSVKSTSLELVDSVVYVDRPEKYLWERGCLLRCELPIKLPIYYPVENSSGKFLRNSLPLR